MSPSLQSIPESGGSTLVYGDNDITSLQSSNTLFQESLYIDEDEQPFQRGGPGRAYSASDMSSKRRENKSRESEQSGSSSKRYGSDRSLGTLTKPKICAQRLDFDYSKYQCATRQDSPDFLGSGRYRKTYLARRQAGGSDRSEPGTIALKILEKKGYRRSWTKETSFYQFDEHENHDHPNIIRLFAIIEFKYDYHIFMELGEKTLSEAMDEVRRSSEVRKYIVCCIVRAVYHLHQHRIVHRDIEPGHILIKERSHGLPSLKLSGFTQSVQLKDDEEIVPKLLFDEEGYQYRAAEVYEDSKHPFPSDIWSIGIIAFELEARWELITKKMTLRDLLDEEKRVAFDKIIRKQMTDWIDDKTAASFLQKCLLVNSPDKRASAEELLKTKYLKDIKQTELPKEPACPKCLKSFEATPDVSERKQMER